MGGQEKVLKIESESDLTQPLGDETQSRWIRIDFGSERTYKYRA